jgi:hypothetical protein
MSFLEWLQSTPLAMWVDLVAWVYPTILTVHGLGMAVVVGLTAVISLRVLGFPAKVPLGAYRRLTPLLWIAFAFNFGSGAILYIHDAVALTFNPSYQIKMASIVVGLVVIWRLQRMLGQAATVDFAGASADAMEAPAVFVPTGRDKALALAAILIWWLSVIVSGRLVAYLAQAA